MNKGNQIMKLDEINIRDPFILKYEGQYYMWYVGVNVIEYNVSLVASKYKG